jgi:CubicO group peptidase (beta-lactamase class C family)
MNKQNAFVRKFGFDRREVTLANWRLAPFNRWSFQNVGELVPSVATLPDPGRAETLPQDMSGLLAEQFSSLQGRARLTDFLQSSNTDALCVMKAGRFIGDWFAPHMDFGARHIVFSITKSLTAILAGILEGDGALDPDAPVTTYLPEAAGSAYGDATVRHVLDMTVSLDFDEAYLDSSGAFARYRRATLWNPGEGKESLAGFLMTLQRLPAPHGEIFRYRSPNSDVLGLIVERAGGARVSDLMRDRLWAPLGVRSAISITVDREGTARTAGGISLTPRDLVRVGEMMRQQGIANGKRIVPEAWVRDTTGGGNLDAWKRGDFARLFLNGRYRNKWYQTGKGAYCGIGIHGQWLFIDPAREAVIAKMSSQPLPGDESIDIDHVAFLEAVAERI